MFERAISSVEIIMCFTNLYICDLLFLEESRTNDRFKARDQSQKELCTNSTTMIWMVRNITNRYTIEEITEEIDDARIRAEKLELVQSSTKWLTIDTSERLQE